MHPPPVRSRQWVYLVPLQSLEVFHFDYFLSKLKKKCIHWKRVDMDVNERKVFFTKSWKLCFLSSFDYTIHNIFQNAICEVIVFSNKTPIGQSDFTIARCTPSAKVEELWKINRNVYFRIEISGIFLYTMTKEVSAGSTKYSGDIDIWLFAMN